MMPFAGFEPGCMAMKETGAPLRQWLEGRHWLEANLVLPEQFSTDSTGTCTPDEMGSERKPLDEEQRAVFRKQFKKTQLCRFYKGSGCHMGEKCQFAHGREELQKAPDLRHTSICPRWLQGHCPHSAETCAFAHGANNLRRTIGFSKPEKNSKEILQCKEDRKSFNKASAGADGYNEPGYHRQQMIELEMQRQQEATLQLQQMIQEQQREIESLKSQLSVQEQVPTVKQHGELFLPQALNPQKMPSYLYNVSL
ncbi:unnamed protein product [Effrenium voratum]|nr:unnamed protein product [Effrenium voratum]